MFVGTMVRCAARNKPWTTTGNSFPPRQKKNVSTAKHNQEAEASAKPATSSAGPPPQRRTSSMASRARRLHAVVQHLGHLERLWYLSDITTSLANSSRSHPRIYHGSVRSQSFMLLVVGVFAGPAYNRGHQRTLLVVGSFGVAFGHTMLSLCTGILASVACVRILRGHRRRMSFPSLPCPFLPTYFSSRIGLAVVGLGSSGSTIGGTHLPKWSCIGSLIGLDFAWSVRVMGFIALRTHSHLDFRHEDARPITKIQSIHRTNRPLQTFSLWYSQSPRSLASWASLADILPLGTPSEFLRNQFH